jgi:hypothetical protein
MEATNVFGAGSPPVPAIDAITSRTCGGTTMRTRKAMTAASDLEPERVTVIAAQRPRREPVHFAPAPGRRCTEARVRPRFPIPHQRMPVEAALRPIVARVPSTQGETPPTHCTGRMRSARGTTPQAACRLRAVRHAALATAGAAAATASGSRRSHGSLERTHKHRHTVLSADHRIRLPLRNR